LKLKKVITESSGRLRNRVLAELSEPLRNDMVIEVSKLFEKLRKVAVKTNARKKSEVGLVGASKILFAVLPEIALPVDNSEWENVFKTENYGNVLTTMAKEIIDWEDETRKKLKDIDQKLTWPAVYNVMAMAVRP